MAGTLYVLDGMTQQTKFGPRGFVQFRAIRIGNGGSNLRRAQPDGGGSREAFRPVRVCRPGELGAGEGREEVSQDGPARLETEKSGYQMLGQMEPDAPGVAALMGRLAEYRINADDSSIRYMLPPTPLADLIATLEPWDRTNSFKLGIKTKEAGKPGDRVEPSSQPTVIDQYTGLKSRLKRPSSDA